MDTPSEPFPSKSYALSGKIMLTAIIVLFSVMILMLLLHLYARWYLRRPRHVTSSATRRRRHTHIVFYAADDSASPAASGLDSSVLASLPVLEYKPGSESSLLECAVCLAELERGERVRFLPKCGHCFHVDCIDMWFYSHATCPICRSKVEKIENEFPCRVIPELGSGLCSTCYCQTHVELHLPGRVRYESSSGLCATCLSNATCIEKIETNLPGRVKPDLGSELCSTCHCPTSIKQIDVELQLPGRVQNGSSSGLCATCHSSVSTTEKINAELRPSNRVGNGSGSGSCATCHSSKKEELVDRRREWRSERVRIEVPRRTELGTESGPSSPASQGFWTPVKRILSMGRRSPMGRDGPGRDSAELDIECGVSESTRSRSRAPTPR